MHPLEGETLEGIESTVASFNAHLRTVCGASDQTRSQYARYLCDFLQANYGHRSIDLGDLQPCDLVRFIAESAVRYKPRTLQCVASALRSFLRFLTLHGLCDARLVDAVPTIAAWRSSDLPPSLDDDPLPRLLESFDPENPSGLRGRAMVACMARLALRAKEVAELSLDDIDWRHGTINIPATKTLRTSRLPLPSAVGEAISTYVRQGRPSTRERFVFVRHCRPLGDPITASAVRQVIRRAFRRASIDTPSQGSHILRHTAASLMLQRGATLKDISDVLRHRSIDTTSIYAKVDLPSLRAVAMTWLEVQP